MKSLVVANWKMNPKTFREAKRLLEATKKAADNSSHVSLVVAPPALFFRELRAGYKGKRIAFAAQNARAEEGGAHTGETSLVQYKDAGAAYVIVGHAERRAMGETNDDTRKKVAAALTQKLIPILCVGETVRSANGEYFTVVKEQLRTGLTDVTPAKLSSVIITYEPLWTIGADKAMGPRDMHEMAIFIRKTIVELKGEQGMNIKILYGGSIDETSAGAMLRDGDVHGLLVGRASEDADRLSALLQAIEEAA
jgi:triosephosphate isomerase